MTPDVYGLILTGGQSSRMGRDKAEIAYGNEPQWRAIANILGPICSETYWSCSEMQRAAWGIGDHGLLDKVPGHGPASGMHAAFSTRPGVAWLVVACDYPFLGALDLRQIVAARETDCDAVAFLGQKADEIEPMLCLWEPAAQARFLQSFAGGKDSPRRILLETRWKGIRPGDARVLTNANRGP